MLDRIAEARAKGQNTTQQAHHVFTCAFLAEVECQLSIIGFVLRQQCDPDIPRIYFGSMSFPILLSNCSQFQELNMNNNTTSKTPLIPCAIFSL